MLLHGADVLDVIVIGVDLSVVSFSDSVVVTGTFVVLGVVIIASVVVLRIDVVIFPSADPDVVLYGVFVPAVVVDSVKALGVVVGSGVLLQGANVVDLVVDSVVSLDVCPSVIVVHSAVVLYIVVDSVVILLKGADVLGVVVNSVVALEEVIASDVVLVIDVVVFS